MTAFQGVSMFYAPHIPKDMLSSMLRFSEQRSKQLETTKRSLLRGTKVGVIISNQTRMFVKYSSRVDESYVDHTLNMKYLCFLADNLSP